MSKRFPIFAKLELLYISIYNYYFSLHPYIAIHDQKKNSKDKFSFPCSLVSKMEYRANKYYKWHGTLLHVFVWAPNSNRRLNAKYRCPNLKTNVFCSKFVKYFGFLKFICSRGIPSFHFFIFWWGSNLYLGILTSNYGSEILCWKLYYSLFLFLLLLVT